MPCALGEQSVQARAAAAFGVPDRLGDFPPSCAESAGASTLTLEHSPEGRRGFFTSFVMTGYASGSKVKDPYSGKIFLVP